MQQMAEDGWVELTRGFLESLYRFTCNYQGYTLINFVCQYYSIMCISPPEHSATPTASQTHGQKCGPVKSRRKNNSKSPMKTMAASEDDAETLDEITWGNDDSISPIFTPRTDSPKAARNSQAFYHNFLGKVRGPCSKQKLQSTHRQRKIAPETVTSEIDQYWESENLDKWCKAKKNISPRDKFSSRERYAITRNISPGDKRTNTKIVNSTAARKWDPLKMKLKLPAKIKSPTKKGRKQPRDFFIVKPLPSKHPTRDEEKTNSELSKSFSGLWRSPGGRQRMKKFTKKRSRVSCNRNMEKPNRPIKPVRCSDGGSSSSSSEMGKVSDQQSVANPSDSSIVFQRDSWIWFSPETRPNAEDFASRQRKFRSQDPRVAALAEEIRRQEELNRDIERTAESLVDSSSHSTGRAVSVSTRCKPSWQRPKIGANRGNICRKSKPTPSTSDHMFHYTHKCGKCPNKGALVASNSLSSTLRTPAFYHGQTPTVSRARVTVDKIEGFQDKYNRKDSGVKISLGEKSKKTDCRKRAYQDGDKRNEFKLAVETDDIRTHNMTVLPLKQKAQIFDSQAGMILGSSGELVGSANLRPDFGLCRNQWTAFEGCQHVGVPGFISEPTSFSDINTLNLFSYSANTQSQLPCPVSVPVSSLASSLQDSTQIPATIPRENCEICNVRERCGASNIACLQAEQSMHGSVNQPVTGSVSGGLVHRHLPLGSRTASSADASKTDLASNPNGFAGKIAFGTSTKSAGDHPSRRQNYRFQLPAGSNPRAPENHQNCIAASGVNSQVTMSVQDSSATDRDKPGLGQACLEEIITAQISAAIQKLFSESTSGTASSIPSCALNNSSSVPSLQMGKCENDQTRNSLAGGNIVPTACAVEFPGTMMTLPPYSQDATSKSLNESPNSLKSECADTYLLDSAQSKRTDNSHSCSNFSCSETKTKNQKRINIYTRAYYLGKRATLNKKRQENTKAPSQTDAKSSLSPWKKPYITWSKTVSLHLYSPTNKLSPRSQIQQKKYERYMRKLKPCLKVPHNKTEQTPKYFSLSEDCLHQENGARSVASDSALMPVLGSDKEALNYSNCQTSCSLAQNLNTRQHDTSSCAHSKQSSILLSTSPHESNNTDLTWGHLSSKIPAHSDSSARTISRNHSEFGRQITGVSNSVTAISYCRNARAPGQEVCRPVASCSNKHSPNCVLPHQRSTLVIPERPEPPPSQVSQLFYVTQTNTHSNQVYSQSKDCRFSKCYLRENPGKFQMYKRSRKLSSIKKESFLAGNFEKCRHSIRNQNLESLAIHPGNIFLSHHQVCGKRGSDETLFLKAHPFSGQSGGSAAFHENNMGIYGHVRDQFHSDIWVTTATNNISLRHPRLHKSCVVEPPHIQCLVTKKQDLFVPPIRALSTPTSSAEESSSSDDLAARNDSDPTWLAFCSSDAGSYTYFPHQTQVAPSVMNVSNPDSGFDEPLSEIVCHDHTVLVGSTTEDSRSPAMYRSLTDDTVGTGAQCYFKSPCSDISDISEPLYTSSRRCNLGVSERDTFDNEFVTSDPDSDTFDTGLDTFDCDIFDSEYATFDTDCDTFDNESNTSDTDYEVQH